MKRWTAMAVLAIFATGVRAETFKKEVVSSSAKWVLHADMEKFRASALGMQVAQDLAQEKAATRLAECRDKFGLDPWKDIQSVTMYGRDYGRDNAVALVRAAVDPGIMVARLKAAPTYEAVAHGTRTIHKWVDPKHGKAGYACFAEAGLAVVGGNVDLVREAIDVLDGRADNLRRFGNLKGLDETAGATLVVSAVKGDKGLGGERKAAVLQNADWMTLAAGETAGKSTVLIRLGANSAESAVQIEQLVRGMVAFLSLSREQNPMVAVVADGIAVSSADGVVEVKASVPAAALYTLMKSRGQQPGLGAAPAAGAHVPPNPQ